MNKTENVVYVSKYTVLAIIFVVKKKNEFKFGAKNKIKAALLLI